MLETKYVARRVTALSEKISAVSTNAGAAIRVLPPEARFSLRLDEAAAKEVGQVAGFTLDMPMNNWVSQEGRTSLRVGPNEWLLLASEGDADVVSEQIEAGLADRFHALVDVSHRNVALEVSGPRAAAVLNSGCPLDLAAGAFPTGSATRTLMGKAEIVLMRIGDEPTYRVECWRSFASYVHDFLTEAAREYEVSAA